MVRTHCIEIARGSTSLVIVVLSKEMPWGLVPLVGGRDECRGSYLMKWNEVWSTSLAIGMPGILPNEMAPTLLVIGMNAEDLV